MFRTEPGGGRDLIEDWINRPALRRLVEAFGGPWPDGELERMVAQLVEFSQVWDYRAGTRSRLMFHDEAETADPFENLTYEAADELGLMNPVPPLGDAYDYLLILGGLATGVEPRVEYAARLLDEGLTVRQQIAGLGSNRELHDKELVIARRYTPDGRYEIDLLAAMMVAMFDGPRLGGAQLTTHAAGTADRPANTAETYDLFLRVSTVEPPQTALLVTSSIYVPYQHLDAVRILGVSGLEVETVGLISDATSIHPARAYRQEIRSVFRAALLHLRCS